MKNILVGSLILLSTQVFANEHHGNKPKPNLGSIKEIDESPAEVTLSVTQNSNFTINTIYIDGQFHCAIASNKIGTTAAPLYCDANYNIVAVRNENWIFRSHTFVVRQKGSNVDLSNKVKKDLPNAEFIFFQGNGQVDLSRNSNPGKI